MEGSRLEIKAIPNALRSEVVGWLGDALKVKVHAPPVEGKANKALCAFLAETLGLPKRSVRMVQGTASRRKLVQIAGCSLEELRDRLSL
jgi:hypothetical protein